MRTTSLGWYCYDAGLQVQARALRRGLERCGLHRRRRAGEPYPQQHVSAGRRPEQGPGSGALRPVGADPRQAVAGPHRVGKPWWVSLGDRRPADLVGLGDAGQIFGLRELMILPGHRNRGLGRQIHDTVIAGRSEQVTTLTCIIDNQPAHDAYPRWGYEIMGEIRHADDSPLYDAMLLPSGRRWRHRPCGT
ncbi:GNAT family N-acetyltransferase [Streptomyces nojiriensis]|uniref:GNAT family N-acetyltransferase n=1 Tax=Streptomyces nojiriensis TaxID=66374 RepID=UPI0036517FBD